MDFGGGDPVQPTAGDDVEMGEAAEFADMPALAPFEEAGGDERYLEAVRQAAKEHKCVTCSFSN